jgi:hypothetical protein
VTVFHSVFGLLLESEVPIPGLACIEDSGSAADIVLHLQTSPPTGMRSGRPCEELLYASAYTTDSGDPVLRVWSVSSGGLLRIAYFDGTQFWLNGVGPEVWATWPDNLLIEDFATYFLGPVLGILLRLRGITCLHASAVSIGGYAIAFVGDAGAGKSTTAAALARRGYSVISDDIVALFEREGIFCVAPAYPYLCLWPSSVAMLYGHPDALPSFSPTWNKRQLMLEKNHLSFEGKSLRLAAIFLLGERSTGDSAPIAESVPLPKALISLVANTYATNLLDKNMRANEFKILGQITRQVPVWRLISHQSPSRLESFCELIEGICKSFK